MSDVEISYHEERLSTRCTECAGSFLSSESSTPASGATPFGTIALFDLPPAGLRSRTPREVLDTVFRWMHLEYLILAASICPRCSGTVEHSIAVCEGHDTADDELCERCNARYAVDVTVDCSNCPRYLRGIPSVFLVSNTEVASFLTDHGMNPVDPTWERVPPAVLNYGEEIVGTDPFEIRLTFTIDDDDLRVTIDETLSVVAATREVDGADT